MRFLIKFELHYDQIHRFNLNIMLSFEKCCDLTWIIVVAFICLYSLCFLWSWPFSHKKYTIAFNLFLLSKVQARCLAYSRASKQPQQIDSLMWSLIHILSFTTWSEKPKESTIKSRFLLLMRCIIYWRY